MEAVCTLYHPLGDGKRVTREQLQRVLDSKNVMYGIDEGKINEIIMSGKAVSSCVIAQGLPIKMGKDASLNLIHLLQRITSNQRYWVMVESIIMIWV